MAQGAAGQVDQEAEISEPARWLHTKQALTNQIYKESSWLKKF